VKFSPHAIARNLTARLVVDGRNALDIERHRRTLVCTTVVSGVCADPILELEAVS